MKRIAVINDLSGFGKCSLTAAIPVLSVQGVQACPLPTAVFSNQTGYPDYSYVDLTRDLPDFISQWQKLNVNFDGILTGFLSDVGQVKIIENFCDKFKKADTLLIVDPVMGDNGRVYSSFTKELCEGIKHISMRADIMTPNLTEFCQLINAEYEDIISLSYATELTDKLVLLAQPILQNGVKHIIITSVPVYEGKISNCIINSSGIQVVSAKDFGGSFSGTGDLFASIVCGSIVKGESVFDAVCRATRFLEITIKATLSECTIPQDGICFEPFLKLL